MRLLAFHFAQSHLERYESISCFLNNKYIAEQTGLFSLDTVAGLEEENTEFKPTASY